MGRKVPHDSLTHELHTHIESCPKALYREKQCRCSIIRNNKIFHIDMVVSSLETGAAIVLEYASVFADAMHSVQHAIEDLVSIYIDSLSLKNTARENYYRKSGGYIQVLLLGIVSLWALWEARERFYNPVELNGWLLVGVGILATGGGIVKHHILHTGEGQKNLTRENQVIHVLGDIVTSIGVAFVGIIALLFPSFLEIDALVATIIGIFLLYLTGKAFWRTHTRKI